MEQIDNGNYGIDNPEGGSGGLGGSTEKVKKMSDNKPKKKKR